MDFSLLWTEPSKITFERVAACIFIGIVIASVMAVFDRTYIGRLVRRLLRKNAKDSASALLLSECGYPRNPFIRLALRRSGSTLRKVVSCTSDKPVLKSEDFASARFYIPEDKAFEAEERFSAKNNGIFTVIIVAAVMFFALTLAVRYFPKIVELFNKKS